MIKPLAFVLILLSLSMQVRAVDYQLPDLDGQMQSLDQYKGKWLNHNYFQYKANLN
jgi:hypothetical protein